MSKVINVMYETGDTVYLAVRTWKYDDTRVVPYYPYEIVPVKCKVVSISINCNKKGNWTNKYRLCVMVNDKVTYYSFDIPFDSELISTTKSDLKYIKETPYEYYREYKEYE